MKEIRYFYAPDAPDNCELPSEEAAHAVRVLRMTEGDEIYIANGKGIYYKALITVVTNKRCLFRIVEEEVQEAAWRGNLHLAVATTKNMDRIEWLAEKATEIGLDEMSFLDCRFSVRKRIKTERVDKILISAMKQSHKSRKPMLNELMEFRQFISKEHEGQKFICHCYDEANVGGNSSEKPFLLDVLDNESDALVLIGPEGDFSIDEVKLALDKGFRPVSLGKSRLRTETAALVAVHLMNLKKSI